LNCVAERVRRRIGASLVWRIGRVVANVAASVPAGSLRRKGTRDTRREGLEMMRNLVPALLGLCVAHVLTFSPLLAADVPQLGSDATADELIDALSPKSGAPDLQYRGLHLLTAKPGGGSEAQMPAVGLDIKFKLNSAQLTEEARETIKQLAAAMRSPTLEKYHFLVEGHTDSTGSAAHNLALSKARAEAVRSQLLKAYSIAPDRLQAAGRGQSQPLDPADPKNPANRRVQVVNLGH
jgi:outer membrane protein OmpA-like peptidoglycan-associated protein